MYKACMIIVLISIIILAVVYLKRSLIYHPTIITSDRYANFTNKLKGITGSDKLIESHQVKTSDNFHLDMLYLKKEDSDKCVIIFHGNAGNISVRYDIIKLLYNFYSVVIFDYRGYGRSAGSTMDLSCKSLQKDSVAIWNYTVNNLSYKPNNIILLGESLGTSMAVWLASHLSNSVDSTKYPHAIVLNSPFYSLSSVARAILTKINYGFAYKLVTPLIGDEYITNKWINLISHKIKIVIAHSPDDEVIPHKEAIRLFFLIDERPNTYFINITGTHNNMGVTDEYIYTLAEMM